MRERDIIAGFATVMGEEFALVRKADAERLVAGESDAQHEKALDGYLSGRVPGLTAEEALAFTTAASPLNFWRVYRKLTQAALAERAGMTQSYLSDLEKGRRDGTLKQWRALAKALELPIEVITEGD